VEGDGRRRPGSSAASGVDDAPAAASLVLAAAAVEAEAKATWWREKVQGDLPRPSTIPLQPKVPNTVRLPILVGSIGAPAPAARARWPILRGLRGRAGPPHRHPQLLVRSLLPPLCFCILLYENEHSLCGSDRFPGAVRTRAILEFNLLALLLVRVKYYGYMLVKVFLQASIC
jgi:hypothetical protein